VVFHGLQAIAKLEQSAAAAIDWPQYSGNLADYPAFMKKWKSDRQRCSVQLEDDQLCEILRKRCMPPAIAR
jgi:hypothetical protein